MADYLGYYKEWETIDANAVLRCFAERSIKINLHLYNMCVSWTSWTIKGL